MRLFLVCAALISWAGIARSQSSPLTCATGAVNPAVRAEGISETLGDILLTCSGGSAGTTMTLNLVVFLNVSVTNRLSGTNTTDVSLTVDSGSGPAPAGVPGLLQSSNAVAFNGVSFTIPASRAVNLRISNLRGNVSQAGLGFQQPIQAVLSINSIPLGVISNTSPLSIGVPARGLLASLATTGIRCVGSPLPSSISFSSLLTGGTRFVSTRLTEGFPDSFQKKAGTNDSGIRIAAVYTGFPAGARIFVPDVVAGSDALQPTAAGDLGGSPSGGAYAPGSGALLLSRVSGTDTSGAGGLPVYVPRPTGPVSFDSVTEVSLLNGAGFVVYEVVDANPSLRQTAQFPTFLGIPPITNGSAAVVASEQISFAPVSSVTIASLTDPVPRFLPEAAPSDCPSLGDCNAAYFPALSVTISQPLQFTAQAGSALQTKTVQVNNKGGGLLSWTASIGAMSGSGWLTINPAAGVNGGTILVNVFPQNLAPGTYTATLTVDAGPQSGRQSLPISVTVTAAPAPAVTPPSPPAPVVIPPAPKVVLQSLVNAARADLGAFSPGSLAIVKGSNFKGKDVAVTFDGILATILSQDDQSITVQVPVSLGFGNWSQLQVTVDGEKSAALAVPISELAPAIFSNGVLNEDSSVNGVSNAASVGSALQIFSTGLMAAVPGVVVVKLHDRTLTPSYAGPAPGQTGVNQVNVTIPDDLPAMTTEVVVCGFSQAQNQPICSLPADVTLQ